ncbi:hypothetical protein [Maliponia aquimaris]|uniref:Uncharacterized protein n=1 Tax=Maliponia aquimaris TaxID=1673631 RepID=A0A238JYS6_9RHOB|nr:hypothetical protein [Maliponia aquimaris]SMX35810.1 hypothetical protein MAA8898_00652 [Maliponia aquimaris]
MKILLIGNSHAAMLIAAHRADPRGETLTVFAKPGLEADDIVLDGPVLRAASPEMTERLVLLGTPPQVDLAQADAVVIAGLAPSVFAAVRLAQGHSVVGWPSGQAAMARALQPDVAAPKRPLMSRAAYRAALAALTETSLAARLLRGLRAVSDAPAVFVPQPYPSEAVLTTDGKYPVFRRIAQGGDGGALAEDLAGAHAAVLGALPGVTVLSQPADTLRHGCLTAEGCMRAAPRLSDSSQQDVGDVLHGNAALGAQLLSGIRAALD